MYFSFQQRPQQVNNQYRPQGTVQSGLLGTIKRLQLGTIINAM